MLFLLHGCHNQKEELPNILWITSEDNDRFLGCYGDSFATSPILDKLASEGFIYTHAYANAPVCAPARNTIITGVLACSNGNEQMRSNYTLSETIRCFPGYLREKGYYCTNNSKTDYNFRNPPLDQIWDESGNRAHYRNRAPGQPFFAVFNITTTHESQIHSPVPDSLLRHRPEDVILPPYHPDTPEMRHDWAQYYDKVEDMDRQVGDLLAELDSLGLKENTIVFYYSDHAGVLGRSKRFLFETGTHVPFIIRIPPKFKKLFPVKNTGSKVERLISFVDLAPTMLSIAGIEIPAYMQGNAFLGAQKSPDPPYIYMFRDRMDERYDMSRSIVNGKFRYTRNYNPEKIYLQHLDYLWRAPSMQSWERVYRDSMCNDIQSRYWHQKPVEELYDIENDRWEVHNLAGEPGYQKTLFEMRAAYLSFSRSIYDAGFLPEAERNRRAGDLPIYDYVRLEAVPYEAIFDAAQLSVEADPSDLERLTALLKNDDSGVRYWAARGIKLLGEKGLPATGDLRAAAMDPFLNVATEGAEALFLLGDVETARQAYVRILNSNDMMARTYALNSIDRIGEQSSAIEKACLDILKRYDTLEAPQYDTRTIKWLFKKWEIPSEKYGIKFPE